MHKFDLAKAYISLKFLYGNSLTNKTGWY